MNLNILRYVIAVDEEKNFTKAAQKLFVAQPSLSQSISALEKQLGVLLFDREKNPLGLTEAGEVFIEWAKLTLHSEEKMLVGIAAVSEGRRRKVSVGISPDINIHIVIDAVIKFSEQIKNCTLNLYERTSKELCNMLDEGRIDLIADMPQSALQYTNIHIAKERILIAAHKKFEFRFIQCDEYPEIKLSDIMDKPFIATDSSAYPGAALRKIWMHGDMAPNIVMECQNASTAHRVARSGIGITPVPEFFIKDRAGSPDMRYYVLTDLPLSREMAIVYRNDRCLSEDECVFTDILRETFIVK